VASGDERVCTFNHLDKGRARGVRYRFLSTPDAKNPYFRRGFSTRKNICDETKDCAGVERETPDAVLMSIGGSPISATRFAAFRSDAAFPS